MLLNNKTWNPPPFCLDYKIGATANHDPWKGLANLMTLLNKLDTNRSILSPEQKPGEFVDELFLAIRKSTSSFRIVGLSRKCQLFIIVLFVTFGQSPILS
jgi:hypothetical protein